MYISAARFHQLTTCLYELYAVEWITKGLMGLLLLLLLLWSLLTLLIV